MEEHMPLRLHFRNLAFLSVAIAALGAVCSGQTAFAQAGYPAKDVRVIVPFSAGGGTDLVTRLFAQKLGEKLGKTFYVENRAGGAGGSVGSLELSRARPDGYSIGTGTSSGIQVAAIDPKEYNPLRDLEPVARYGATTIVLVVNPKLPIKTVAEFVSYAKAHPGLAYGSSGVGSTNHMPVEKLAKDANIVLNHIPYRGEGVALTDVISGQVGFMFVSLAAAKPHIDSGTVRAIAVSSERRFPAAQDLPTMAESGFKDFVVEAWYGLYVPKDTPASVVDVLVKSVNEIRSDPEISKRLLTQLSFDTSGVDDPEKFRAYMQQELERYSTIAAAAGLKKK
jgi:tripartite-type tricarboxylate transporter receptor subunit TctC